jgi:hypothetical protein
MTPLAGLARAPIPSLGVVLVGCPDCRALLGLEGAEGLAAALAEHRRDCPAIDDDVCAGCGCEAELYPCGTSRRCGDCLGELLSDTLTGPPIPARPRVRAVPSLRLGERQGDAEPDQKAVA